MQKTFLVLSLLLSIRAQALTNSTAAIDLSFQNVVYFEAESHLKNGDSVKSYCDGTLVSNRFIVTAAHCVAPSWLEKISVVHIKVGRYVFVKSFDGKMRNVGYRAFLDLEVSAKFLMTRELETKLQKNSSYGVGPAEDLAIIELEKPLDLPQDFQFARIVDKSFFENQKFQGVLSNLESVTINTVENISNSQPKRYATLDKVTWFFQGYYISLSTSRFAPDDSGGPIFVKVGGEGFLIGVVKGKRQIFNYDVFTPVRDLGCEIASAALAPIDRSLFCR